MGRKKTNFDESLLSNMHTYYDYYDWLMQIALTCFEWKNLPLSIDERFMELCLFNSGMCVFFKDEYISDSENKQFLALNCLIDGELDVYNVPIRRTAYASNGYQKNLTIDDSVIIYNNYMRMNDVSVIKGYAQRLYNLDRSIDVNANAQKTPILLQCDDSQKLSVLNAYKEFDGNAPVIFAGKNFDLNSFKVLSANAPYVSDKLYELKVKIWNEALTYLGVANISQQKRERMVVDEVIRQQGGVMASRNSRLLARKKACALINDMYGLDVDVAFRDGMEEVMNFE